MAYSGSSSGGTLSNLESACRLAKGILEARPVPLDALGRLMGWRRQIRVDGTFNQLERVRTRALVLVLER